MNLLLFEDLTPVQFWDVYLYSKLNHLCIISSKFDEGMRGRLVYFSPAWVASVPQTCPAKPLRVNRLTT